jgi:hypothetical protein
VSPILGIWASQNYARYSITGSYESIATVTVGSGGSSSVSFTSIPSTYTHLQLRIISRNTIAGTSDDWVSYSLNSDTTTTNYYRHRLYGSGSAVGAESGNNRLLFLSPNNGNTASIFGTTIIDILDYANTNKYKTTRVMDAWDGNGSGYVNFMSSLWKDTSAITSITFSGLTFVQYSHFALYGIKGA